MQVSSLSGKVVEKLSKPLNRSFLCLGWFNHGWPIFLEILIRSKNGSLRVSEIHRNSPVLRSMGKSVPKGIRYQCTVDVNGYYLLTTLQRPPICWRMVIGAMILICVMWRYEQDPLGSKLGRQLSLEDHSYLADSQSWLAPQDGRMSLSWFFQRPYWWLTCSEADPICHDTLWFACCHSNDLSMWVVSICGTKLGTPGQALSMRGASGRRLSKRW